MFQHLCQQLEKVKGSESYQRDVNQHEEYMEQRSQWGRLDESMAYQRSLSQIRVPSSKVVERIAADVISPEFVGHTRYLTTLSGGRSPKFGVAYHAEIDTGQFTAVHCRRYNNLHQQMTCEDFFRAVFRELRPALVGEILRKSTPIQKE